MKLLIALLAVGVSSTLQAQELRMPSRYAEALFAKSAWADCVAYFSEAAGQGADYSSIYFALGTCQAKLGRQAQALEALSQAVSLGFRGVDVLKGSSMLTSLRSHERWAPLVSACQRNADAYEASLNPELLELFNADQRDRRPPIDEAGAMVRDEVRRNRVLALLKGGSLHSAGDFFHAAFLLHHSCRSEDYASAHELATRASALDPGDGGKRWLVAATKDRFLSSSGKAQLYGTQLTPIDPTVVSDSVRLRMCVRPIQETLEAIDHVFKVGP